MKINILVELKEGAWGGGNQFLKALRREFVKMGVYEDNPAKAEIILFNSFPFREEYRFRQIAKLKKAGKIIIHRVDGPISEVRGTDSAIDKIIFSFNDLFASGTVFQSNWSRAENYKLGMKEKSFSAVILNAPDPDIFNRLGKTVFNREKVKLIATSWSANPRKGFAVYEYLDEHLDFTKYQMSFFGNSPIKFKNIIRHEAVNSRELAEELKKNDIFVTASQKDPCSNSLIEALSCGLPAVCLNDGGHPEIVGGGGEVFNGTEDILAKIDRVAADYAAYQARIKIAPIGKIAQNYFDFISQVNEAAAAQKNSPKNPAVFEFYKMLWAVYFWQARSAVMGKFKKFLKR
jgi:glycosyltransferase involved in cell wall biosynthesis